MNLIQSTDVKISVRWLVAFALLTIGTFASAVSWHDDSRYVRLGPRTGYYIVRPGSALSRQLDIEAAPIIDTADPFRHGYGADALAFRFNHASILSAPPSYIVQATPDDFYTRRLGSLIRGRSSSRDVEAFFGRPQVRKSDETVSPPTTQFRSTILSKIVLVGEVDDKSIHLKV